MKSGGAVYIITNKHRNVFYIGVTNNIQRRMYEHKKALNKGFAKKYNCNELLYVEYFWDIADAIQREKILKKWNREWKLELITKDNPDLIDLSKNWFDEEGELIDHLL